MGYAEEMEDIRLENTSDERRAQHGTAANHHLARQCRKEPCQQARMNLGESTPPLNRSKAPTPLPEHQELGNNTSDAEHEDIQFQTSIHAQRVDGLTNTVQLAAFDVHRNLSNQALHGPRWQPQPDATFLLVE